MCSKVENKVANVFSTANVHHNFIRVFKSDLCFKIVANLKIRLQEVTQSHEDIYTIPINCICLNKYLNTKMFRMFNIL